MLRNHDARFDLDLRLGLIEDRYQLANRIDVFPDVGDDESVATTLDFNRTSPRQSARDDRQQALITAAIVWRDDRRKAGKGG